MSTFADAKGRQWRLEANVRTLKRCRAEAGIDPLEMLQPGTPAAARLAADPYLIAAIGWCLLVGAEGTTPEAFDEGLDADAMRRLSDATLAALIAFLPEKKRAPLARIAARLQALETARETEADAALQAAAARLEAAPDATLATTGTSSAAASPGPSASTPAP